MPPSFTLDQLLLLDAIDRTGSFAAAARSLHRVPSAATHAVRALEDAVGVVLFDKQGRRAVLTPAGRALLAHARDVLREVARLDAVARGLADGWEDELRVVVDGALPTAPVARAVAAVARLDAPTRVRVDAQFQDGVAERFVATDAQIMLTLELDAAPPGLPGFALPALELVLCCGADHPLAGAVGVPRDALHAFVDLVVRDSSAAQVQTPRPSFVGAPRVVYLPDFHHKRDALLAGAGFGWMPRHLVDDALASGALVPVDLVGGGTWTYLPRVVHRDQATLGRAARAFLAALAMGEEPSTLG